MDPMDFINEKLKEQASCLHPGMMYVLPGSGQWRRVCSVCGYVRMMTAEEIKAHEEEIGNGL
jgi:hypothetical protein